MSRYSLGSRATKQRTSSSLQLNGWRFFFVYTFHYVRARRAFLLNVNYHQIDVKYLLTAAPIGGILVTVEKVTHHLNKCSNNNLKF
jgi:hypothetical protein